MGFNTKLTITLGSRSIWRPDQTSEPIAVFVAERIATGPFPATKHVKVLNNRFLWDSCDPRKIRCCVGESLVKRVDQPCPLNQLITLLTTKYNQRFHLLGGINLHRI